jgi:hypothetical protein
MPGNEWKDETITHYLLDRLPEGQREAIEEASCLNTDFFERIGCIEEEVIRGYLDGQLSQSDSELFERKYFRVPELRQKVAFVRALRQATRDRRGSGPHPAACGRHRTLFSFLAPICAGLSLVVLGVTLLMLWNRPKAPPAPVVKDVKARDVRGVTADAGALVFVLSPFSFKGAGIGEHHLALPTDVKEVRLLLELPGYRDKSNAHVSILRMGEQARTLVRTFDDLPVSPIPQGGILVASVPASDLTAGEYVAIVKASRDDPDSSAIQTYSFVVERSVAVVPSRDSIQNTFVVFSSQFSVLVFSRQQPRAQVLQAAPRCEAHATKAACAGPADSPVSAHCV